MIRSWMSFGYRRNHNPSLAADDFSLYAQATLAWIARAHQASREGGISKGYDLLRGRWGPAYPETTGYSIPTLLNSALVFNRPDLNTTAFSLADYLLLQATAEGGVGHWLDGSQQLPIVFDTGQVIFGWLAAYKASNDERYLAAARRAGDWLVSIQDSSGAWKASQYGGFVKVIDARVAWALLELQQFTGQEVLLQAATSNLAWVLTQQDDTGWFFRCGFTEGQNPYTHTLAYTAEGLYEGGRLLRDVNFISAARSSAQRLLSLQRADGFLAGSFGPGWSSPSSWSCLTGNCQMARLWLSMFQEEGEQAYLHGALRAIEYVARTVNIQTSNRDVYGAIAGSSPIYGSYERFKFPNWAAKFFVDAIIKLIETGQDKEPEIFVG